MKLTPQQIKSFQKTVWDFYKKEGRHDMIWRKTTDPYHIVVSEIMLQQTQVSRVTDFYLRFLKAFPNWQALANAPLKKVFLAWQGLGYNRRALYLKKLAETVTNEHKGKLPQTIEELVKLPSIGKATAGAILAYAFNKPAAYIETNIRRIYIHHFFKNKSGVHDDQLMPLVEQTISQKNAREWYWALMDYGTMLVKTLENPNKKSRHYVKQSQFEGSRRQVRSTILKTLLQSPATLTQLKQKVNSVELESILTNLVKEGHIKKNRTTYTIA